MREVVTFQVNNRQLVGTLHRPSEEPSRAGEKGRFAFLWLNSGYLPRSPVGDLISHMSDSFAEQDGVCSFRVDMPGLGDSQGSLTDDTQTYFSRVTRGLNVEEANAVARDICQRFGFEGVLMGGICGGAITSTFAADIQGAAPIAGLVLLDPSFKLIEPWQAPGAATAAAAAPSPRRSWKDRIQKLRVAVLEQAWGKALRRGWRAVKPALAPVRHAIAALRSKDYLPADANVPLLEAFRRVARRRLPIVVVMAGDERENAERFDYVGPVIDEGGAQITRHFIAGTNHAFVEGNGPSQLREVVAAWLQKAARPLLS